MISKTNYQTHEKHYCSHGNGLKASGDHERAPQMWAEDIKVKRNEGIPAGTVHMSGVFVNKELIFLLLLFFSFHFLKLNEEFRWKDMLSASDGGGSGGIFFFLQ